MLSGISALLGAIRALERDNGQAVLATVVKVEGSAYRRPGARMLIPLYGGTVGTISGGCLESEVAKKAWWLTDGGEAVIRRYSTATQDDDDDQDAALTFGLGCNGTVHVLLERPVRGHWRALAQAAVPGADQGLTEDAVNKRPGNCSGVFVVRQAWRVAP